MQLYWRTGRAKLTPPLAAKVMELAPAHQFAAYYQAISQQLNGDLEAACLSHRRALQRNTDQQFSAAELDLEVAIAAYEIAAGNYPGSPGLNEDALVEAQAVYDLVNGAMVKCLLQPGLRGRQPLCRPRESTCAHSRSAANQSRS